MPTKVFDAYGEVHANTADAERAINRLNNRISVFGDGMLHADRMSQSFTKRMRAGFSTGMLASIQRNEGGLIALGNAFEVAGMGMKKTENESVLAYRAFQRMQRIGYSLQAVLGSLAGSIGDLAGGVLSLVGVLGQAAFALAGVGGALVSVIGGFAVARIAMSGVSKAVGQLWNGQNQYNKALRDARKELKDLKFDLEGAVLSEQEAAIELEKARTALAMAQDLPPDNMVRREAELAYQRADLNYRRAKSRVEDLQDTIKRGGNAAARAANADPFRGLTKSQIAFTKFLVTLKPQIQALKEAAASSFLPPLKTAIETIVRTTFPTLMQGFRVLGSAMGYAANAFADIFKQKGDIEALKAFFDDSAPRIRQLGEASGRFMAGFLNMLKSAQPLTDRFVSWIDSISIKLETLATSQQFSAFLRSAGTVAAELGKAFGSFAGGIGNIMAANFPPGGGGAGQVLLDWLKGIGKGFEEFTGSDTFASWLKSSTENATVLLGVIGDFLHIFIDLAAQPEIKQFWMTLQEAIPNITKMLMDGIKAGPSFAALIVSLTDLFVIFSDSGALQAFFDTLKAIVDMFSALLTPLKPVLDFIGKIHGFFLAIGLALGVLSTVGMVFMGFLGNLVKKFGQVLLAIVGAIRGANRFNHALSQSETVMATWGAATTRFIRGMGNANVAMNRNASDYFTLNHSMKEWKALMASKPTMLQRVTGGFKIYSNAVKEAFAANKQHASGIKGETAAEKAAGVADKQRVTGLKLIRQSFRDVNTSIKEYITSMKAKTDADIANNAAARRGLATQREVNQALREGRLINRQAGAGVGAGRFAGRGGMGLIGAGFAAEGLISGAANGGMTAGSALTTIGGAAMFLPGAGMIAGLGLSIVGSIVQGFEAADRAKKEEEQRIQAEKIEMQVQEAQITAEKLNEKKSELSTLLGQKGMTYEKAVSIMNANAQAVTGAATVAGLGEQGRTALDQFRLLLRDQGITQDSPAYKELLTAGAGLAKTLSLYGDVNPQDLIAPIMSTFKSAGTAGLAKFGSGGIDQGQLSFIPGTNNTQVRISTAEQRGMEALSDYRADAIAAIAPLTNVVDNLSKITSGQNTMSFYGAKAMAVKTEDLKKLLGSAYNENIGTRGTFGKQGDVTRLTPAQAQQYLSVALGTGAFADWIKKNPTIAGKANPVAAAKLGIGTNTVPTVVTVKPNPGDIEALRTDSNNISRTAAAMEVLKGAIKDGKLQVTDVSKSDKVAPQLKAPPGATKEYSDWVNYMNAALVAAWGN